MSKKSSRSSKSRTFNAQTADELVFEELDFDKWGADLFEDASEQLIRDYIEAEAKAVQAERENDLQELKKEEADMETTITALETEANDLEARAQSAAEKQEEANGKIAKLKEQINNIKGVDADKKAQISDLNQLANDMSEQRNKWVKDVNKKNFDALLKAMATNPNEIHVFIMDSLAKFFTADPNSTFKDAPEFFTDHLAFGAIVRKVKPEKLDRETCKKIAHRVNQDEDQKVGDVQNYMLEVDRAEENLPFYPHYKLLFKITQMAITIKKRDGLKRKLDGSAEGLKQLTIDIETWETISKNLDFGTQLKAEADRMRKEEIKVLQQKHDSLKGEIEKLDGKDFIQEYFAELLGTGVAEV